MYWHSDEDLPVHDLLRWQSAHSLSGPACEESWPHIQSGTGVSTVLTVPARCDRSSRAHGRSLCCIAWKEAVDTDADCPRPAREAT